jgi:hypothetical protein
MKQAREQQIRVAVPGRAKVRHHIEAMALVGSGEGSLGQEDLDRISVLWSDLRYCGPASTPNLVSCVVWAGGVFDRNGRALTQEVKVGRLVQTRRPPG